MLLPSDHIDLLVSATNRWHLLSGPGHPSDPIALEAFGRAIHQANLESEAAKHRLGRLDSDEVSALASAGLDYTWRDVPGGWEPVDVLKATHVALDACSHAPRWRSTKVHEIVQMLGVAASQRLPGYEAAQWVWQRPGKTTCAIGYAGTEQPIGVRGLVWVDASTLETCWDSAVVIVLTPSALDHLDDTLPARRNVVILNPGGELTAAQWDNAASLGSPQIIEHQMGLPWLEELIAQRPAYVDSAPRP